VKRFGISQLQRAINGVTPINLAFVEYNESGLAGDDPPVLENFRILIDLSDTVNYKHKNTGALEIWSLDSILGRERAASKWEMFVGVVLAVSPANVTVGYLEGGTVNSDGSDPVSRVSEDRDYAGAVINLRVMAGVPSKGIIVERGPGAPANGITVETAITSATLIKTTLPGDPQPTATPATGDLIMRVRKTMGEGTLRARHAIRYRGIV
jgi:hypothetical protein